MKTEFKLKPRYKVTIRVIDAMTIRPFVTGPLAESWTVDLVPDLRNNRMDARPRPVWQATETAWVWGFDVGGRPISLPEMLQALPGKPLEFEGFRLNAAVVSHAL